MNVQSNGKMVLLSLYYYYSLDESNNKYVAEIKSNDEAISYII